jgi:hypothetical protein
MSLFIVMEKYGSLKYMGASIQTVFYNLSGINLYEHTTKAYLIRMNSCYINLIEFFLQIVPVIVI